MKRTLKFALLPLMLTLGICSAGCAQPGGQVPPTEALTEWPANTVPSVTGINRVPYISTYYIQPRVPLGTPVTIRYYVTDFEQKEYAKDDLSETFTVDYWVNGVKKSLPNVKPGDNSFTINGLREGKVLLALQCTDKQGLKSHRLYHEFLVINPANDVIAPNKILTPDLARFGIHKDGTHPVETTRGLTEMLKWASENGYRKVVLPKGTYLLDEKSTVRMATKLILDMNGSTFKLNPNALASALMFEFVHCFDSHVENGTFEGDLKEHDFKNAPNNSEWVNAVNMGQDASYCSLRNVKIVDVTGYGTSTSIDGREIKQMSLQPIKGVGKFIAGEIGPDGKLVPSELRMTTEKSTDIAAFVDSLGFIQFGLYLGYQGNPAGNWVYKASFYAEDDTFLESIEGYMYRRLYPPKAARKVKFTLFSRHFLEEEKQPWLTVFNFRAPYNCAFINVHHENIRCVGMAISGFNNLLIEGCTFENCGSTLAKCAFDAEDGWDLMQDLTFRNNVFGKNPNNEFLTCAGHNFVMENNVMKVHMWDRTRNAVFRNNKIKSASYWVANRGRTGFPRFSNNDYQGPVVLTTNTKYPDQEFLIRDAVLPPNSRTHTAPGITANMGYFYKCKVDGGTINGRFVNCEISNIENGWGVVNLRGCIVKDSKIKSSGPKTVSKITDSTLTNCEVNLGSNSVELRNNKLIDTVCHTPGDWQEVHEIAFCGNTVQTSKPYIFTAFNSFGRILLQGNKITATAPNFAAVRLLNPVNKVGKSQTVVLVDNQVQAPGGHLLHAARAPFDGTTMALTLKNNKLEGLVELSEKLIDAPSVNLTR